MLKKENRICRAEFAKSIPEHIALESGGEAVIGHPRSWRLPSRLPDRSRHSASLHGPATQLFLQLVKRGQNLFTMAYWVNVGIDLRHFALGIDQEGLAGREFHYGQVRERTIGAAHYAVCIGQ